MYSLLSVKGLDEKHSPLTTHKIFYNKKILPYFYRRIFLIYNNKHIQKMKTEKQTKCLPLYTAGTIAARQLLNLIDGNHIVVSLDGVLQTGCCHGKLNGFL